MIPRQTLTGAINQTQNDLITSQHSSAWHCYIGRWLSKGKMLFSTSRHIYGKTNDILELSLASVITVVQSTMSQHLV